MKHLFLFLFAALCCTRALAGTGVITVDGIERNYPSHKGLTLVRTTFADGHTTICKETGEK